MNAAINMLSAKRPIADDSRHEPTSAHTEPANDADDYANFAGDSRPEPTKASRPALTLITGQAPDPMSEIPAEPEPNIPPSEAGESRFKRLRLATSNGERVSRYVGVDPDTGTVQLAVTSEEDFIQLWAVDAWEFISELASLWLGVDVSDIETEPDEMEQARKAASRLYKLAHKYPRMLGWMLHEKTIEGGDVMIVVSFFMGKVAVFLEAWRERKQKQIEKRRGKDD